MLSPALARAADDVQDLVFQGDKQALRIRLHVRIDGKPYRQAYREAWRAYVEALFRQLDHDADGFLSEAEAAQLPPAQALFRATTGGSMAVNVAFNFKVVDANGDGKVSLAELLDYYDQYGGQALQALFAPPVPGTGPQLGDVLFRKLDTNGDGKLSRAELTAAVALLDMDRHPDETLSAAELAPQVVRGQPGGAAQLPESRVRSSSLPRSPFTLPASDDEPGRPPDVELIVRLGERSPGEEPVEVIRPTTNRPGLSVTKSTEGSVYLMLDGTLIELCRNDGRPALVEGLRQRLVHQFHAADDGHKGYLTPRDAQRAGFFPDQFGLLDRDGDGKLTERELLTYLDEVQPRQARAVTCATAMLISDEGRGLFDLLDRNRDGRLGLRELRAAAQLPTLLGKEKDGTIGAGDIPRTYRIAIGLCEASFDRFGGRGVFTPRGMPLLALDWSPPGLAWFHKMDRNHDGDVSRHEFLGSREEFDRLDTDGDGLISLEEAERALARRKER